MAFLVYLHIFVLELKRLIFIYSWGSLNALKKKQNPNEAVKDCSSKDHCIKHYD